MTEIRTILGDCMDEVPKIPDNSIDLFFTDLPYGVTQASWDSVIDMEWMWEQAWRVTKPGAPLIFTAIQPFTTRLIHPQIKHYRHHWIYQKACPSNSGAAGKGPKRYHEDVIVFGKGKMPFYPIMEDREGAGFARGAYTHKPDKKVRDEGTAGLLSGRAVESTQGEQRFPSSVKIFNNRPEKFIHPTQKPTAFCKYFIESYSARGAWVLDMCAGSYSCGLACKMLERNFIGIEKNEKYHNKGVKRLNEQLI